MSMFGWCNQADGLGDFKGTAADMAAHEARKRVMFPQIKDPNDVMTDALYGKMNATLAARDQEIKRLHQVIEDKQEIIDKFVVKSNGLSIYVRSDIAGRSNLPRLDEKLWDLYNFQCEVEFPEEEENINVDPSTI